MAYSVSAPPFLVSQGIQGGFQTWGYRSTDVSTAVDAANYITNGGDLGLIVGGVVYAVDTDETPPVTTLHQINATGNGTTDLTNATTITQTDSD